MKKWISIFCFCSLTLTLSGCLPYFGFYEDLAKDVAEDVAEPVKEILNDTASVVYDSLLDATGCKEDGFISDSALLKVTSLTDGSSLTFTDDATLAEYARTLASVTAKGIFSQINHNKSLLPLTAEEIYSYTLWSHYDADKIEEEQPFTCSCTLYESSDGYYLKAEYTDERIEDSPYYLLLKDWKEDYFLDLAEGK